MYSIKKVFGVSTPFNLSQRTLLQPAHQGYVRWARVHLRFEQKMSNGLDQLCFRPVNPSQPQSTDFWKVSFIIQNHKPGNTVLVLMPQTAGAFNARAYCFTGKVTRKVEPCPGMLLTVIRPPCRSTILRAMARPIPGPAYSLRPTRR